MYHIGESRKSRNEFTKEKSFRKGPVGKFLTKEVRYEGRA